MSHFQPLEVVDRGGGTQLQVVENVKLQVVENLNLSRISVNTFRDKENEG